MRGRGEVPHAGMLAAARHTLLGPRVPMALGGTCCSVAPFPTSSGRFLLTHFQVYWFFPWLCLLPWRLLGSFTWRFFLSLLQALSFVVRRQMCYVG